MNSEMAYWTEMTYAALFVACQSNEFRFDCAIKLRLPYYTWKGLLTEFVYDPINGPFAG